jgi:SlyX protein
MSDERLTELEIRFSHQDQFLQELNQVVVEQQIKIERLEKEILDLKRNVNSEDVPNEKPPHY